MYQPHYQRQAAAYRRVDVETLVGSANPHQLVALLFEELMRNIQAARGLMEQGDMGGKGAAIGKSVRLLEEGLKAGLNAQAGGSLAASLRLLYDGVIMRLTLANARNDAALLDQAAGLIAPIRDAWREIGSQVPAGTHRTH